MRKCARGLRFAGAVLGFLATLLQANAASAADRPFGIAKRVPWATSRMIGSPQPPSPYLLERVFPQLEFNHPVELLPIPGTNRMLVVEVDGRILSFPADESVETADLAIHIGDSIEGATRTYGFAFHPDFDRNRQCFISYVTRPGEPHGTHVSRFRVTSVDPLKIDVASEEIVITWLAGGHNGGSLQFGPEDGLLYISTGDAAPPFPPDPERTGQDITDLEGSILRIDVDHPTADRPYSIPDDNPFLSTPGARGEVWTYGHRNPWRMSFDRETGHLWVGDVGWEMWEMVYRVQRGANYGWSILEHVQSVNPEAPRGPTPIVPATAAHSHTESRSVTGGYVYRGSRLPDLVGTYLYGDYVTGRVWGINGEADDPGTPQELLDDSIQIICFGQDHNRELFVVDYGGAIYRLVKNPDAGTDHSFPQRLSETGLFSSVKDMALAPGVIPYDVNAAPWEDGTTASRFLAVPGLEKLGVHQTSNVQKGNLKGEWSYPDGSVLGKTISLEVASTSGTRQHRLETQILYRFNDSWRAFSYHWNNEQTDAVLSDGKAIDRIYSRPDAASDSGTQPQTWHFASQTECLLCHSSRGGTVYGFRIEQLNRNFDYGENSDNQLRTLAHLELFEEAFGKQMSATAPKVNQLPKMASPHSTNQDLQERVRSYLHVNCSHCHRRGGGGTAAIELVRNLSLKNTRIISRPTQGSFGIVDPWIVAPGDPDRSILYYRMSKVGRGRMPHFASRVIDDKGLALIREWIAQLETPEDVEVEPGDDTEAAEQLAASLQADIALLGSKEATSSDQRKNAIDRLLSSTSGSIMLASAVRGLEGTLHEEIRDQVIASGTAQPEAIIRDLFEAFVPENQRVEVLGTKINAADLLVLKGNAARGLELFSNSLSLACRNCHRAKGVGKALGPDLDGIGKRYSRAEILENILEPSKKIDPKFQTWLLQTTGGQVYSGLLVSRSDTEVVLRDATGKEVNVPADDVELMVAQKKSLMPELQFRGLTPQDAADLLAWLSSLK